MRDAKALDLDISPTLLARADEVIEWSGARAAWPLAARAQQASKLPTVGFVNAGSPEASARYATAFRNALGEAGYVEGQNVTVEYHWLEGHNQRVPAVVNRVDPQAILQKVRL